MPANIFEGVDASVPLMSARDASPPPTARARLVVPSPELLSSSEDEDSRRVTAAPRCGRHNLRPSAASNSANVDGTSGFGICVGEFHFKFLQVSFATQDINIASKV